MKYISTIIKTSLIALIGGVALSSCSDFEKINTNQMGVTLDMSKRDGIALGGKILALERTVIPVGTQADGTNMINQYQVAYNIGPDTWSGYFSQVADWSGGTNHTTYFLMNGWVNATFNWTYTQAFTPWLSIKSNPVSKEDPVGYALAQVLKISTWHKATDTFGPIPYTKAGTGLYITPYDSQEVVYRTMLQELRESIKVLTTAAEQNVKLFPGFDAIYDGDATKWVKYANSLMLRLAMRVKYADAALAKEYAEEAVNHRIGVMTLKDDMAKIGNGAGLSFVNNIETLAKQYNETRMGLDMFSYLVGYEDPRLPKYFSPSSHPQALNVGFVGQKYLPYPPGMGRANKQDGDPYSMALVSLPNIKAETPTYWLRASEVYFLRAEGALEGWSMGGTAEDLYTKGIGMSFEENGISAAAVRKYMNSSKSPAVVDLSGVMYIQRSFTPKSNATVQFNGTKEQKLEKIMTQKWIALYPNGMEAWTEWRRTGYPKLFSPVSNRSGGLVDSEKGIRRMHYTIVNGRSAEEQQEYDKAVTLLGGPDTPATNLWWDKKNN